MIDLDALESKRRAIPDEPHQRGPYRYVTGYGFNFHPSQDGERTPAIDWALAVLNGYGELIRLAKIGQAAEANAEWLADVHRDATAP